MNEIWKTIDGYEEYLVSSLGRVFSLKTSKVLKPYPNLDGYLSVSLHRDGKQKTRMVHKLVAEAFIGPRPAGLQVCHGPMGSKFNRLTDLSYGTRHKNGADDRNRDNAYSSRYPGVDKAGERYRARIQINGKNKHLGIFTTQEEAAQAYREAREELAC